MLEKKSVPDSDKKNMTPANGDLGQSLYTPSLHTPALYTPELSLLNQRHDYPLSHGAERGGTGILGRLRRICSRFLREQIFPDYFLKEQEFQTALVRHLNAISEFVELHARRLDDREQGTAYSVEHRLTAKLDELRREVFSGLAELRSGNIQNLERIDQLEGVATGLERILQSMRFQSATVRTSDTQNSDYQRSSEEGSNSIQGQNFHQGERKAIDYSYLLLENRYRGKEDEIERRLSVYPPLFSDLKAELGGHPVLEVGAGRGELQRLFRSAGIPSYGIEIDQAMVQRSREQGYDVRLADVLEHLRETPDRSLGGIIAIQVVEHLPPTVLEELFSLARRKLVVGGHVVFETINSESLLALTHNYFRDPTHVQPLHPETMRFLLERSGLKVLEVKKLSPYPEGAKLQALPENEFQTPLSREMVTILNRNLEQMNALIYAPQDYYIHARVTE